MKAKELTLEQILGPAQLKQVKAILSKAHSFDENVRKLKSYFRSINDVLEPQDIYPEYLAYVVATVYDKMVVEEHGKLKLKKKKGKP